ncbi:MAG TPA: hypothetical protein VF129_14110 [Actinomycetota bacterium]
MRTAVVVANGGPAILVVPASSTLDLDRLGDAVGDPVVITPLTVEHHSAAPTR